MPPELPPHNPAVRRALSGLAAVAVATAQVRGDDPTWTLAPPTFIAPQPLPAPPLPLPVIAPPVVVPPPVAPVAPVELAPMPRPAFDRELAPMPRTAPEPPLMAVPSAATPTAQPLQSDPATQGAPVQPEYPLPPDVARPSLSSSPAVLRAPEPDETLAMPNAFKSIPAALLGAALAAAPALADDPATKPAEATKDAAKQPETVESLKKQLDAANDKLADQDKELKSLRLETLGGTTKDGVAVRGLRDVLRDFEAKFEKLSAQYAELSGKVAQSGSTSSKYTPDAGSTPQPMAGGAATPNPAGATKPKAKIQVRNYYAAEVTLVLNDVSFKVKPNETIDVTINAGDYSYELAGAPRETKFITANDTMVLSIR